MYFQSAPSADILSSEWNRNAEPGVDPMWIPYTWVTKGMTRSFVCRVIIDNSIEHSHSAAWFAVEVISFRDVPSMGLLSGTQTIILDYLASTP